MRRAATIAGVAASLLALAGCGGSSLEDTLGTLSGTGDFYTGQIYPERAWDETYSWDCSAQHSQGKTVSDHFSLVMFNADDDSLAAENPTTSRDGLKGEGTLHFTRPGAYSARINTACDWRLKAVLVHQS